MKLIGPLLKGIVVVVALPVVLLLLLEGACLILTDKIPAILRKYALRPNS